MKLCKICKTLTGSRESDKRFINEKKTPQIKKSTKAI